MPHDQGKETVDFEGKQQDDPVYRVSGERERNREKENLRKINKSKYKNK